MFVTDLTAILTPSGCLKMAGVVFRLAQEEEPELLLYKGCFRTFLPGRKLEAISPSSLPLKDAYLSLLRHKDLGLLVTSLAYGG